MSCPETEPDDEYDDDDLDPESACHTCLGDGYVDSVAAETGRHGWDDEGPGKCPNCKGSGLAKDCWWW